MITLWFSPLKKNPSTSRRGKGCWNLERCVRTPGCFRLRSIDQGDVLRTFGWIGAPGVAGRGFGRVGLVVVGEPSRMRGGKDHTHKWWQQWRRTCLSKFFFQSCCWSDWSQAGLNVRLVAPAVFDFAVTFLMSKLVINTWPTVSSLPLILLASELTSYLAS